MNIEDLRNICLSFPHVTEDMKWGENLCFLIGLKIFVLFSLDESPVTAAFKVSEEDFLELSMRTGFHQASHFARSKWIATDDIGLLGSEEWNHYLEKSYKLVWAGLPNKVKDQLK